MFLLVSGPVFPQQPNFQPLAANRHRRPFFLFFLFLHHFGADGRQRPHRHFVRQGRVVQDRQDDRWGQSSQLLLHPLEGLIVVLLILHQAAQPSRQLPRTQQLRSPVVDQFQIYLPLGQILLQRLITAVLIMPDHHAAIGPGEQQDMVAVVQFGSMLSCLHTLDQTVRRSVGLRFSLALLGLLLRFGQHILFVFFLVLIFKVDQIPLYRILFLANWFIIPVYELDPCKNRSNGNHLVCLFALIHCRSASQQIIQCRFHRGKGSLRHRRVSRLFQAIGAERTFIKADQGIPSGVSAYCGQPCHRRNGGQGNCRFPRDHTARFRLSVIFSKLLPVFAPPSRQRRTFQNGSAAHFERNTIHSF